MNVRKHGRGNEKMDNPERLPKLGTQDTGQAQTKSNRLIVEEDKHQILFKWYIED
jgi:hypothetical protein